MDSLTHIVLGGCIGEGLAGKKLGKKALLLGAVAQSLPDIDFVASIWLNPANDLLAHRGFTHSFLFIALTAPVLALLANRWLGPKSFPLRNWTLFFGLQMFLHVFLDAFNTYGVGWFEPFSHARISFNTLFVADPFLSVGPAIGFVALAILGHSYSKRRLIAVIASSLLVAYLGYCLMNKALIDSNVRENLRAQQIDSNVYFSTPTPLNNWLWYVVVNTDRGSHIGYRSVFDSKSEIDFEFFTRGDSLLKEIDDHEDLQRLRRFSQGFYTAEQWGDTLVFNDLRFGQMIGWRDRRGRFVFHYFLSHPRDNNLVVQRGRFARWDEEAAKSLLLRMRGN